MAKIVTGGTLPYWASGHATLGEVRAIFYDWAVDQAARASLTLIEYVTRARAYPEETAQALGEHMQMKVTVGKIRKVIAQFF